MRTVDSLQGLLERTVLKVHLDGRSIWCLAHPRIQVLAFTRFEKENIIAIVQIGKLIELVELALGI